MGSVIFKMYKLTAESGATQKDREKLDLLHALSASWEMGMVRQMEKENKW